MLVAVGVLVLVVLAGMVALWPRGQVARPGAAGPQDRTRVVPATLTRVETIPCEEADPAVAQSTCIKVEAELAGGRRVTFDTTDPTGDTFRAGQRVKLTEAQQQGAAGAGRTPPAARRRPAPASTSWPGF